jgi:hypothetical protein
MQTMMKEKERERAMKAACQSIERQIRNQWGRGFDELGRSLKEAIITERVFYVFAGRDPESTITGQQMSDYNDAVQRHFGLRGDDE